MCARSSVFIFVSHLACITLYLQVMNVNSSSIKTIGLVGYLPHVELGEAYHSHEKFADCQHHILQECVGRVVAAVESRASYGFRCLLGGETHVYFPKLGAMALDTKERQKYFGLRSQRACGFCRLRNGRSVVRTASRQDGQLLQLLFKWSHCAASGRGSGPRQSQRAKARAKLLRHGWNYKKPCRLLEFANYCLVPIPRFGVHVPFAGLIHFERMHVFFINYCNYLLQHLANLVTEEVHFRFVRKMVQACQQFRDPVTGTTLPRLRSVLKMTHLTAERRVKAIFYWAHVLGTKAEVICRPCRGHAQIAVSTLQLLLIATRGRRAYSETELNIIFKEVGGQFFTSIEAISKYFDQERMKKERKNHERDPTGVAPPVPYKRLKRYFTCTCGTCFTIFGY